MIIVIIIKKIVYSKIIILLGIKKNLISLGDRQHV